MKQNKYLLNTLLTVVVGVAALICLLVRTFAPSVVIPNLDIPNMVLLSLVALLADRYLAGYTKRCYWLVAILGAATFGLLPYAAAFATLTQALKNALVGGVVFTVITALYTSIEDRLSSGPACKAAPILSALGLYLAVQCFAGMF